MDERPMWTSGMKWLEHMDILEAVKTMSVLWILGEAVKWDPMVMNFVDALLENGCPIDAIMKAAETLTKDGSIRDKNQDLIDMLKREHEEED